MGGVNLEGKKSGIQFGNCKFEILIKYPGGVEWAVGYSRQAFRREI